MKQQYMPVISKVVRRNTVVVLQLSVMLRNE
jgi:hypothetical protein